MSQSMPIPSLETLKDQAKRLRSRLKDEAQDISHSKALELIAAQLWLPRLEHDCREGRQPPAAQSVDARLRVSGHYLGQPFKAEILSVQALTHAPGRYRITFDFEEPVDVVTFDSFSAFRKARDLHDRRRRPHRGEDLQWPAAYGTGMVKGNEA